MTACEGRAATASDDNDNAHPGNDWRPCPGTQPGSSRPVLPAPPTAATAGGRIQASHRAEPLFGASWRPVKMVVQARENGRYGRT